MSFDEDESISPSATTNSKEYSEHPVFTPRLSRNRIVEVDCLVFASSLLFANNRSPLIILCTIATPHYAL